MDKGLSPNHRNSPTHVAKVGHRKSRTGCRTCVSRRVKCDEARPVCGNCSRLGVCCGYSKIVRGFVTHDRSMARITATTIVAPSDSAREQSRESNNAGIQRRRSCRKSAEASSNSDSEAPAGRGDREGADRMELRLLHAWMSRGLDSKSLAKNSEWRWTWLVEMPRLALEHDNLLYALLALSATQLTGTTSAVADPELSAARFKYWSLALSEQQKTIASGVSNNKNTEALAFSAILISITAFAMLRDRELEPYAAPVAWFEVSKGAKHVWPPQSQVDVDGDDDDKADASPLLRGIVSATAPIWAPVRRDWAGLGGHPIDPEYAPILHHYSAQDSAGDIETYRRTLALLTSFREAVLVAHEPAYHLVRRICIFPQSVPSKFVGFLRESRPRALVVLACFFAVAAHAGTLHYFGDAEGRIAEREVRAIARAVPEEWRGLMIRPVDETMAAGRSLR